MSQVEITVLKDGPYLVKGEIALKDAAGNLFTNLKDSTALCRCGHSKNKPFCDGTHKTAGFSSEVKAV
ncbi:MAG: CDGSH iron-sulfur domain-containing protein [Firmicutes bacterium]|jgi:CDGSH-type Zn-finger protein|nr:CDGSH iron-sulfur domain-containing protein [Bacillota bacterium]